MFLLWVWSLVSMNCLFKNVPVVFFFHFHLRWVLHLLVLTGFSFEFVLGPCLSSSSRFAPLSSFPFSLVINRRFLDRFVSHNHFASFLQLRSSLEIIRWLLLLHWRLVQILLGCWNLRRNIIWFELEDLACHLVWIVLLSRILFESRSISKRVTWLTSECWSSGPLKSCPDSHTQSSQSCFASAACPWRNLGAPWSV